LRSAANLERALADGVISEQQIESYQVSVALGGRTISHTTQPRNLGREIAADEMELQEDGSIILPRIVDGRPCDLRFVVDLHIPDFIFDRETPVTPGAQQWLEDEGHHLFRHARIAN